MSAITQTLSPRPSRIGRTWRPVIMHVLYFVGLPAVLLAAWWISSRDSSSMLFPPLSDILADFGPTWMQGRLMTDALPSIGRLLAGYGAAVIFGIAFGMAIGLSPKLRAFIEPVSEFFRAVPAPVLVPVLMLLLGIGTTMKVFVIAFGSFWPVLLNTTEGVRALDSALRDVAQTYHFRRGTFLTAVVLRGASPQIMAGARQALSLAVILMVISEMFAANNGLGFTVVQFQRSFAIPEMWTGILLLGVLGMVLSAMFRFVEARVLNWYDNMHKTQRGGGRGI
ncbi:ABC-type nitrate/sulfonate/bicarbonate transport system permease component [Methylovirgula ligni]|uniref:ABC-type nitrate/sulfonate/bicarbonate transport system permease component n=1 Tax=Methylovirgula ligni TaxID=569860 RepID=A0A3D9YZH9_9HYPH|nr:ABC transporter permease [Methylovirgula ligni]REF86282.1 ABC-type nitrate/sulfonate/bicarbonate transport system permease component [Methylovirgula ligni]